MTCGCNGEGGCCVKQAVLSSISAQMQAEGTTTAGYAGYDEWIGKAMEAWDKAGGGSVSPGEPATGLTAAQVLCWVAAAVDLWAATILCGDNEQCLQAAWQVFLDAIASCNAM